MDKNYIVELIKANRLQEAINLVEKASKNSSLQNELIILAGRYSEYAKLNRSATLDFQTLEMQRNQIANSLLSFLEEMKPEDLAKVEIPVKPIEKYTAPPVFNYEEKPNRNKMYLYAGIGAAVLLLLIIIISSGSGEDSSSNNTELQASNVAQSTGFNFDHIDINVVGRVVVKHDLNGGISGEFYFNYEGNTWEFVDYTNQNYITILRLLSRNDRSMFFSDDENNLNLQLNLTDNVVTYKDDHGDVVQTLYITSVK
jgi:Effector-associated domain 11